MKLEAQSPRTSQMPNIRCQERIHDIMKVRAVAEPASFRLSARLLGQDRFGTNMGFKTYRGRNMQRHIGKRMRTWPFFQNHVPCVLSFKSNRPHRSQAQSFVSSACARKHAVHPRCGFYRPRPPWRRPKAIPRMQRHCRVAWRRWRVAVRGSFWKERSGAAADRDDRGSNGNDIQCVIIEVQCQTNFET